MIKDTKGRNLYYPDSQALVLDNFPTYIDFEPLGWTKKQAPFTFKYLWYILQYSFVLLFIHFLKQNSSSGSKLTSYDHFYIFVNMIIL